jgi:hypothetical protein
LKDQDRTDPDAMGSIMNALFNIELGIDITPPGFRIILNVLLNRIIEKRLEYYMPLEDEEEGAMEDIPDNEENDS